MRRQLFVKGGGQVDRLVPKFFDEERADVALVERGRMHIEALAVVIAGQLVVLSVGVQRDGGVVVQNALLDRILDQVGADACVLLVGID